MGRAYRYYTSDRGIVKKADGKVSDGERGGRMSETTGYFEVDLG